MSDIPSGWTRHYYQGHPAIVSRSGEIVERVPDWPGGVALRYRVWSAPEGMTMGRRNLGVFETREAALAAVLADK